jgi:amidase
MPHAAVFEQGIGWSYTRIYNLTGWPAAVVRGGTSPEGLPIGVQVVARPWREDVALAVAGYLETALGGWQPPPY